MAVVDQRLRRPDGLRVSVGVRAPPGHRVEERAQPGAVRLMSREVAVRESGSSDPNLSFTRAIPASQGAMSGLDIDEDPLDYEEEDPVHGVQSVAVEKSKKSRRAVQRDCLSCRPQDLAGNLLRGEVSCEAGLVGVSSGGKAAQNTDNADVAVQVGVGDGAEAGKLEGSQGATDAVTVRLPREKVQQLVSSLEEAVKKPKLELRWAQSLLVHLNFAFKVVRVGRAFCRRLRFAMRGAVLPHHHVRLRASVKEDLRMWIGFLQEFNGVTMLVDDSDWFWQIQIFSDASGAHGFGLFWDGHWAAERWPLSWRKAKHSIAFLEFFPLVALSIWGSTFANRNVVFNVDNQSVVNLVNSQRARDEKVLKLLRVFLLKCLTFNVIFKAKYVPGVNNDVADALSRFQWQRFCGLAPGADVLKTAVPGELWELGE
ncbi:hypothetical protein NDU88_005394 [Pleurodeles waltl]|uniref:RNase H type-1 domain-containing protein n=1 Tax=Pleurodeles waltl TaxID=8319 RepID=A0AAV7RK16_PLEWA|nr:hypothetical protein NDU88_005394 [Pleurodeles waltl]